MDLDKLRQRFDEIKDNEKEIVAFASEFIPRLIQEVDDTRLEVVKAFDKASVKAIQEEQMEDKNKRVIIQVPANRIKELQDMIDNNIMDPTIDRDNCVEVFTAQFGDGIEADIKVVNSKDGPWIDPVLFDDGHQCGLLEPDYQLEGEYNFGEYNGYTYIVELVGVIRVEVRTNCEYITEIVATSVEEAIAKAQQIDVNDWDQKAWAPIEGEEIL